MAARRVSKTADEQAKGPGNGLAARLRREPGFPVPSRLSAALRDALADAPPEVRARLDAQMAAYPQARAVLAGVAAHSPFLTELIRVDPARLARLLESDPVEALAAARAAMAAAVAATDDEALAMAALRRLRAETALAVALADIGGVLDLAAVTAELTATADACIAQAVDFLVREAVAARKLKKAAATGLGYTVLAMGKHGARELNYSSDVDLIVLYDPDAAPLGKNVEAGPFFVRLTQRLVKLIQERTGEGYVARVDLRLRPDPASTPAALSLDAALDYYEREGATWERAAYIKARPIAGDIELGHVFLRHLSPFVWRRSLDLSLIHI